MVDYTKAIGSLKHPGNIKGAEGASSLVALIAAFERDTTIGLLLAGATKRSHSIALLTARELTQHGAELPEISRTCFAWILDNLDPDLAAEVLQPLFVRSMKRETMFFTPFAAYVLRKQAGLTTQPGEGIATDIMLRETLDLIPGQIRAQADSQGFLQDEYRLERVRGITTRKGAEVPDLYRRWLIGGETDEWRAYQRNMDFARGLPEAEYRHLDGHTETLGPAARYNCHGFCFLPRRLTIGGALVFPLPARMPVDWIIDHNCVPVPRCSARPGDIIRYKDTLRLWPDLVTTHTGRVCEVYSAPQAREVKYGWPSGLGGGYVGSLIVYDNVKLVRSKLSTDAAEVIHDPYHQPIIDTYSTNVNVDYHRQFFPLRGQIADLWIKTHPDDIGEQCCVTTCWESPDIKIAEGPLPVQGWDPEQAPLVDSPVFGRRYRIWAKVRNRGDLDLIQNVYIAYYWAYAGTPMWYDWRPIAPSPIGPFSVPGRAGMVHSTADPSPDQPLKPAVNAPWVDWTPPTPLPAQPLTHLCFLAMVSPVVPEDSPPGDDPTDRYNPDPIVYPFDPAWDNNIAMRNVTALAASPGGTIRQTVVLGGPRSGETIEGAVEVVVTRLGGDSVLGFSQKEIWPETELRLEGVNHALRGFDQYLGAGGRFAPDGVYSSERPLCAARVPYRMHETSKMHELDVIVTMPKEAESGAVYYLRLAQSVGDRVTGGWTLAMRVS